MHFASEFTFLGQWWSGSDCTVVMEKKEDLKYIGKEHTIVVMNHKYDIDWLMTWILAERFEMLGVSLCSSKYYILTRMNVECI